SVVIDDPAPRLLRHPHPAVLAGVDPSAVAVGAPLLPPLARPPDTAVVGVLHPIAVGREWLVEIGDGNRRLRACAGGHPQAEEHACRQSDEEGALQMPRGQAAMLHVVLPRANQATT